MQITSPFGVLQIKVIDFVSMKVDSNSSTLRDGYPVKSAEIVLFSCRSDERLAGRPHYDTNIIEMHNITRHGIPK